MFLAALSTISLSSTTQALTLKEALFEVKKNNPDIRSAAYEVEVTREVVRQRFGDFFPEITATSSFSNQHRSRNQGLADDSSQPFSYGAQARHNIFTGGRVFYSHKEAKKRLKQQQHIHKQVLLDTLIDLVESYMDTLRDQQLLEIQEDQVKNLELQLEIAQKYYKNSQRVLSDVKQAEASLEQARANLVRIRGSLENSESALARVYGSLPSTALKWPEVSFDIPNDKQAVVLAALDTNPGILAAKENLAALQANSRRSKSAFFPEVTFDASFDTNNDRTTSAGFDTNVDDVQSATVQVRMPLFRGGKSISEVRQANYEKLQGEVDLSQRIREVSELAENDFDSYKIGKETLTAFEKSVKSATAATESFRKEYKLGTRTIVDVLNSEQDLLDANTNIVNSKRDIIVSAYRILAVMGRLNDQ